jgi:hypothetical protein
MTTEQILKLDNIQYPEDMAWRSKSYDAGHPECLCSACGQPIKSSESFINHEQYFDSAGNHLEKQLRDNFPIRLVDRRGQEAVLHTACFQFLHAKGVLK